MCSADKGVYGCGITWSCQSNINSNVEQKLLLFHWSAVAESQESLHLHLAWLRNSLVLVPLHQHSNLQRPSAEEGELYREWFIFTFSNHIWCRTRVFLYSLHIDYSNDPQFQSCLATLPRLASQTQMFGKCTDTENQGGKNFFVATLR